MFHCTFPWKRRLCIFWQHFFYFLVLWVLLPPEFCCCRWVAEWCPTLCDPIDCSTPGFPVLHHLSELAYTHVHWVGDVIQNLLLCGPLLLPSSIFPSIRAFSNELALGIRSFSFSISPSNEYSGLISFRIDWFDLFAVWGILKSLLQPHSSKASILQHSALFMVQILHPYMTTGKTIAFTIKIFVDKVISLLLNMLSRFVFFHFYLIVDKVDLCGRLFQKWEILWWPFKKIHGKKLSFII